MIQCLGDSNHLHFACAEVGSRILRPEAAAQLLENDVDALVHLRLIDENASGGLVTQRNVLCDGHILNHIGFLMNLGDFSVYDCVMRILEMDFSAVQIYLAIVLIVHAVEDIQQRTLACAILAQQGMNFAFAHRKRNIAEHAHAREVFVDPPKLYCVTHRSHPSRKIRSNCCASTAEAPASPL